MNNQAAIGYMIIAARHLEIDEAKIKELEHEMKFAMDEYSEEEAEEAYKNN